MKSLLDIQQDIRNLEINVKEITENIRNINDDIEEIRGSADIVGPDYEQIKLLAKRLSFESHPLKELKDSRACKIYLEMLLSIIHLDLEAENTINRFVFIQWLQMQAGIDWSLEDLYKDSLTISRDLYYEFVEDVPEKYQEYFMVDALIVANIGGNANREVLEYIVDMSTILGISRDKLQTLSLISRIILCQNIDDIEKTYMDKILKNVKEYKFYIGIDMIEKMRGVYRKIDVALQDSKVSDFSWKIKQASEVNEGDLIATYWRNGRNKIKATSSGTIFQFRDNNTNYGVIAHETDSKDSIKAWVKANRRQKN